MSKGLADAYRERSQGHADLWECTVEQFINQVLPVVQEHQKRNHLSHKVVTTVCQFLRIKFDRKELKGTPEHEVATAIEESLIYYVNVKGEEV